MVDFPTRADFLAQPGSLLGIPTKLTPKEIADLFADLSKLHRREKAAIALVTALRQRLTEQRSVLKDAAAQVNALCSFLATLDGAEAQDRIREMMQLADRLRETAGRPETVDVPIDPLPDLPKGD